jgi:hypothetical protein
MKLVLLSVVTFVLVRYDRERAGVGNQIGCHCRGEGRAAHKHRGQLNLACVAWFVEITPSDCGIRNESGALHIDEGQLSTLTASNRSVSARA